jgi:BirA family biotin operon repressor/biotin-[acetyl-CoA-carboxylase] ligase
LYDVVDSTNLRALDLLRQGEEEGTLVITEEQTAGRGRRGNIWSSEKGKNLLFSLIIKPRDGRDSPGLISLTAALSVAQAVVALYDFSPDCKWPNDVLSGGKKFCGILPESISRGGEIFGISLGIGINVNQTDFPPEISDKTISLCMLAGRELDRYDLLAGILAELENNFRRLGDGHKHRILLDWKSFSSQLGRKVSVNADGKKLEGIAEDVADDGGLIIRDKDKLIKILAGDISYDTRI